MARHFPIFIDLGGTPPLFVGAQPALTAKLRLLTGFTLARHLREAMGHSGVVLGCGHLIPDQADYLRRCGFSHVEIAPGALALSPPPMQQILSGGRARDRNMATS